VTDDTGAFCRHARPRRPGRSAGPLTGLTFAAKDIIAIEGVTPCFGNPTWLDTHCPAARDAHSIGLLLEAGANLDGITITDELALSLTGENPHYVIISRRSKCRFPLLVSFPDVLTRSDALCLTRCHLASVSVSCHFFRTCPHSHP
jgi:hypothetical protein